MYFFQRRIGRSPHLLAHVVPPGKDKPDRQFAQQLMIFFLRFRDETVIRLQCFLRFPLPYECSNLVPERIRRGDLPTDWQKRAH
jgi:hypothetical protein